MEDDPDRITRAARAAASLYGWVGIPFLIVAVLADWPLAAHVLLVCMGMILDRIDDTLPMHAETEG